MGGFVVIYFGLMGIHLDKKIGYLTPKNSLVLGAPGACLEHQLGVCSQRVLSLWLLPFTPGHEAWELRCMATWCGRASDRLWKENSHTQGTAVQP